MGPEFVVASARLDGFAQRCDTVVDIDLFQGFDAEQRQVCTMRPPRAPTCHLFDIASVHPT